MQIREKYRAYKSHLYFHHKTTYRIIDFGWIRRPYHRYLSCKIEGHEMDVMPHDLLINGEINGCLIGDNIYDCADDEAHEFIHSDDGLMSKCSACREGMEPYDNKTFTLWSECRHCDIKIPVFTAVYNEIVVRQTFGARMRKTRK